ncbi:MAG: MBL fold metallo-hydrolase [Actinomycetia bacterium]|nr:MBL fold metallo-hydrolase [Actinomycetes bacterium]
MLITAFASPLAGANCYLVASAPGAQCVIIDPGAGVADWIDRTVTEHRLRPVAVLATHGHIDHTFGVTSVCQAHGVPAYLHPADRRQLTDPWPWVGMPSDTALFGRDAQSWTEPDEVRELCDGDVLDLAGLEIVVRHAPGHTAGSVLLAVTSAADGAAGAAPAGVAPAGATAPDAAGAAPDAAGAGGPVAAAATAFTGDVLFAGTIGRTDLPGASPIEMTQTLRDVVLSMDDRVVVRPGHGPATTIGQERSVNPYLRGL